MEIEQLEKVATLIGEPARIKMLWALMDGRAYTATELAIAADVSPQSASMHLSKLVAANFLKVISQGRHRYYSYHRAEIAYVVESLASLVPQTIITKGHNTTNTTFRYCRSCYDHLAGTVGVAMTDRMLKLEYLIEKNSSYELSVNGYRFFNEIGINTDLLLEQKRPLIKPCLDWSERRFHLAGSGGAAMLQKMLTDQWLRRVNDSRTLVFTSIGRSKIYDLLGLVI